ncbi:MAG: alpha/beta fold hydrolase [Acidimicrobiales bacterium]
MSNPVLLVHGFATSARRTWQEPGWIDLLTDAGREVIAPDLLGHGDNDKPHDTEAYAEVEELVLAAIPEGAVVDAVGYSAGARIVLTLAAKHPERFGKLVIAGMGARLFEPREDNPLLDAIEGRADPDDMVGLHFKQMSESDGNDPLALAAFLKRTPPPFTRDDAAGITNPTLVIIGDADFAGPGEPLAEALPNATLVTLRNVDHFGLPKAMNFLMKSMDFLDV